MLSRTIVVHSSGAEGHAIALHPKAFRNSTFVSGAGLDRSAGKPVEWIAILKSLVETFWNWERSITENRAQQADPRGFK
jgi:hypothetical protein